MDSFVNFVLTYQIKRHKRRPTKGVRKFRNVPELAGWIMKHSLGNDDSITIQIKGVSDIKQLAACARWLESCLDPAGIMVTYIMETATVRVIRYRV